MHVGKKLTLSAREPFLDVRIWRQILTSVVNPHAERVNYL